MTDDSDTPFDNALLMTRLTDLRTAMKDKSLTPDQKLDVVLRNEEMVLMLILNDHDKVATMWRVFRPMAWGLTIAIAGLIGLAIAGHISIAIVP